MVNTQMMKKRLSREAILSLNMWQRWLKCKMMVQARRSTSIDNISSTPYRHFISLRITSLLWTKTSSKTNLSIYQSLGSLKTKRNFLSSIWTKPWSIVLMILRLRTQMWFLRSTSLVRRQSRTFQVSTNYLRGFSQYYASIQKYSQTSWGRREQSNGHH